MKYCSVRSDTPNFKFLYMVLDPTESTDFNSDQLSGIGTLTHCVTTS